MGGLGENEDAIFRNFPRTPDVDSSESDHSDWNRKILLTAIVSLSIVLVLVFALHLYARYVLTRQARRRRAAIHRLSLTVAHAQSGIDPPTSGLDPTLISALPMFVYNRKESSRDDDDGTECSVCLSSLEDAEMARLLPNCKHIFHVGCIDTWLASHSTCPICRTKAEPFLEPQPREGPTGLGAALVDASMATAPPLPPLMEAVEGTSTTTSDGGSEKINGSTSNSRLSSFRRIISRERSFRRIQPSSQDDIDRDLERQ